MENFEFHKSKIVGYDSELKKTEIEEVDFNGKKIRFISGKTNNKPGDIVFIRLLNDIIPQIITPKIEKWDFINIELSDYQQQTIFNKSSNKIITQSFGFQSLQDKFNFNLILNAPQLYENLQLLIEGNQSLPEWKLKGSVQLLKRIWDIDENGEISKTKFKVSDEASRDDAKKLLYNTMKEEGWHDVLFTDDNPKENSALVETVIDVMMKFRKF